MRKPLRPHRILLAEDEYVLAIDLAEKLEEAGATVVGPVSSVSEALAWIDRGGIDAAVLDVNLRGEMAYAAADLLIKNGLPFVFATGYDKSAIPDRFSGVIRCEKPFDTIDVTKAVVSALQKGPSEPA